MSKNTSEVEILTIMQVADYLKVTERRIDRLAATKKIPTFKVRFTWRFSCSAIDTWIKQQTIVHLEPLSQHSDLIATLNNFGYLAGPLPNNSDAENATRFKLAVDEFQCDHDLQIGSDPAFQTKRLEILSC
ncbi:helix-turn-helix domain-containing protein [Methylomonas sp. AM2-LC]|uniref:helix-turn-helix domain-containing protein n=1 Tax=Methylomonas sp. AM2-LC TaxID=3153301 RepID=UPI003264BBA7